MHQVSEFEIPIKKTAATCHIWNNKHKPKHFVLKGTCHPRLKLSGKQFIYLLVLISACTFH